MVILAGIDSPMKIPSPKMTHWDLRMMMSSLKHTKIREAMVIYAMM
jgi:hypothetical protein